MPGERPATTAVLDRHSGGLGRGAVHLEVHEFLRVDLVLSLVVVVTGAVMSRFVDLRVRQRLPSFLALSRLASIRDRPS